jgi:hypothetical protein
VDWTWQSAGRIDSEGYAVEVRVPLQSIRFRGGDDVRMGVPFFRRNSRLGISWSWPEMRPGQWVFESNVPAVFPQLTQPRLLEVIPSATMSANQARGADSTWPAVRSRADFGASLKYGITSTITLDATVNPDFSQVEDRQAAAQSRIQLQRLRSPVGRAGLRRPHRQRHPETSNQCCAYPPRCH